MGGCKLHHSLCGIAPVVARQCAIQRLATRLLCDARLGYADLRDVEYRYNMVGVERYTSRTYRSDYMLNVVELVGLYALSRDVETRSEATCIRSVRYGVDCRRISLHASPSSFVPVAYFG